MGWLVRIDLPEIDQDLASSALWDVHTTGIAQVAAQPGEARIGVDRVTLLAGFDEESAAEQAVESLRRLTIGPDRAGSEAGWTLSVEPIGERTWVDGDDERVVTVADRPVTIEVGGVFGHGDHPTTRLVLQLLEEIAAPAAVLDFGTGTGILALAAAVRGASSVTAVDNDPVALAVAGRNWERNDQAGDGCDLELLDALPAGTVDRFDLAMANVLLPVHREHGPSLARALRPGGALIVAGVLSNQGPEVEHAYRDLRPALTRTSGDWLGMVLS